MYLLNLAQLVYLFKQAQLMFLFNLAQLMYLYDLEQLMHLHQSSSRQCLSCQTKTPQSFSLSFKESPIVVFETLPS